MGGVNLKRESSSITIAFLTIAVLVVIGGFSGIEVMSAIGNAVLAGVTASYVVLTYRLLVEARDARLDSLGSYVVADVESVGPVLHFVIRNIGRGPATNIEVKANPPIVNQQGKDLTGYGPFAGLGPFQERRYFFYVGMALFDENSNVPLHYSVTVRYQDVVSGKRREHVFELDLESYRGTLVSRKPEETIAKAVEDIARESSKVRWALERMSRHLAQSRESTNEDES